MMIREEIFKELKRCLVLALGIDENSIHLEASIVNDLGADSIDVLDAFFRIEQKFGIKISMEEIQKRIQGNIADEEFYDKNRRVTRIGLKRLQEAFPEVDLSTVDDLAEAEVFSLISVRHLLDFVIEKKDQS